MAIMPGSLMPIRDRVSINGEQPLWGVSCISEEDSKVFKALKVKLPSQTQQMSLL